MREKILIISSLLAIIMPLCQGSSEKRDAPSLKFPGFPTHFEEKALIGLPMSEVDQRAQQSFPGEIGKFTDGEREILIRWVEQPTRQLHPTSDCFKGSGYSISKHHLRRDSANKIWSCFTAERAGQTRHVCETIFDESKHNWSDPSSWYWEVMFRGNSGPWWSVAISEGQS